MLILGCIHLQSITAWSLKSMEILKSWFPYLKMYCQALSHHNFSTIGRIRAAYSHVLLSAVTLSTSIPLAAMHARGSRCFCHVWQMIWIFYKLILYKIQINESCSRTVEAFLVESTKHFSNAKVSAASQRIVWLYIH